MMASAQTVGDMAEKPHAKEVKPPPGCKAILLYERTMIEAGTKKVSLLGLIRTLTIADFPGQSERMRIFLQLVEGIGEYDIRVEVHDLAEDRIIFRARAPRVSFPNRLDVRQLSFLIPALPLHHPGKYDVIVFGNGMEIDRQQFHAELLADAGEST